MEIMGRRMRVVEERLKDNEKIQREMKVEI